MACFILVFFYVQFELSYDRFHEHADRIYRLVKQWQIGERNLDSTGTPAPLASALLEDIPEIEAAVRIEKPDYHIFVQHRNDWILEENILLADPSILDVFSFPLAEGDPNTVLRDPASMLMTEEMAEKYFGDESPIGRTVTIRRSHRWFMRGPEHTYDFCVAGILRKLPLNSHFRFDFIIPFQNVERLVNYPYLSHWGTWNFSTYILIRKGYETSELEVKLPELLNRYRGAQSQNPILSLQPLSRIYLHSESFREIEPRGSVKYLYFFSTIAVGILVIACINFMNLSTARYSCRAREVGLRKVIGARRRQIAHQFLFESVSLAFLALPLAILLVELVQPIFCDMLGKIILMNFMGHWIIPMCLVGLTLVVGLAAGGYPAGFVSLFSPMMILSGNIATGKRGRSLRDVLVVFQFMLSVIFVIGMFVVFQQLRFIRHRDMGLRSEHVLQIPIHSERIRTGYRSLKQELLKNPNILSITSTGEPFFLKTERTGFWWEGLSEDEISMVNAHHVDQDFLNTFGIRIIAGHDFTTDEGREYVINESMVKRMGLDSPEAAIGMPVEYGSSGRGRVVGVVADFHFKSLHEKIEPLVIDNYQGFRSYVYVSVQSANIQESIDYLKRQYSLFDPDHPFEHTFLDRIIDDQYQKEEQLERFFRSITFVGLFIASMGLFGLVSYAARRKTKEIGIRKVLGASETGVLLLLIRKFVFLILTANMIAWPIAYLLMNRWLQDFAYRVRIGIGVFLVSTALSLIIAMVTIGSLVLKAATANPVDSLRYE